jgi:phosphopentomutase
MAERVFLIVLDSCGIGAEPDCADFGDVPSNNTFRHISASPEFSASTVRRLGMGRMDGVGWLGGPTGGGPLAAVARMRERSRGKDTTIGHWEIAGVVSPAPLPTYPDGFPAELIEAFSRETGRGVLCNKPYSGTEVIRDYGQRHIATGDLIVYTSADSVFQIAANTEIIPLEELYHCCEVAREMLTGDLLVGRVIARPYVVENGVYRRTSDRKDYALSPPAETLFDKVEKAGLRVHAIGKTTDIFNGRGVTSAIHNKSNADGVQHTYDAMEEDLGDLIFTNLVDFDSMYGHRRDPEGYGKCVEEFDAAVPKLLSLMKEEDVLILCADHGNDPCYRGWNHTREYVPMLICGAPVKAGTDLGTRASLADIAATVAEYLGCEAPEDGESFWKLVRK